MIEYDFSSAFLNAITAFAFRFTHATSLDVCHAKAGLIARACEARRARVLEDFHQAYWSSETLIMHVQ